MLYNGCITRQEAAMKYLYPILLTAFVLLLILTVLLTRGACPVCGRPIYLFLFRFCGC